MRRHLKGRNRHHLRPRARGGTNHFWNLLIMDVERHNTWHNLFGNLTLEEVIMLLQRLERHKSNQRERAS